VIGRRLVVIFKIRNTPLTPADAFRQHESQTQPTQSVRPRLTNSGYVAVIFAVATGGVGAGVTYATLHKFQVDHRFAKAGQTIIATVLSTSRAHHEHIVRYEFQVDGQTYQGAGVVPKLHSLTNARKSKEIEVKYLPSDPAINRPAEEVSLPILIGLMPLALLALCVGLPVKQLRRDFVLTKIGRLTTGIVVGIQSGLKSSSWVHYDFLSDHGDVTRGKSALPVPYCLKIFSGCSVQVLYLPGYPKQNALKFSTLWQT
jgi:hypothetical protein